MNMAQITVMKDKNRAVVAHCGKTIMNTIMEEKAVFNAPNGQTEAAFSYFFNNGEPGKS